MGIMLYTNNSILMLYDRMCSFTDKIVPSSPRCRCCCRPSQVSNKLLKTEAMPLFSTLLSRVLDIVVWSASLTKDLDEHVANSSTLVVQGLPQAACTHGISFQG